ncbi:DnaT-like ssDNA-binding domain-containing protein [Agaribacter flavus]|uniref:DnaT-like ssDNA-binding domain-containing protein n=1 Tax=Agaribacter flavus TaxID=1902781 RepID=A0ABV7FQU4_9ALTE
MNIVEIEALKQAISNEARVLYTLYLRPMWTLNSQKITIKNKAIIQLLNAKTPRLSLGREITDLFVELSKVGLVKFEEDIDLNNSLNNQTVSLPLLQIPAHIDAKTLHQQHQAMSLQWRPSPDHFEMLCKLLGVITSEYSADELGEFIAYWLGRPEINQTPYQWTQKFVLQLKQRRLQKPAAQGQTKAGHQWMNPKSGLTFDQNVENLVKQYSQQDNKK